jgi:hypothetical protein
MQVPEDPIRQACETWGYTPREAQFLWLVTAFGGHFIREQYNRFIGVGTGTPDQVLCRKLLSTGHAAAAFVWGRRHRTDRYHVCGRALYRVFGRENSTNRKAPKSNSAIAVRVAMLDLVLAEPDVEFLLSDQDRLDYLRDIHGITDPSLVPTRVYPARGPLGTTPATNVLFPDRFPMGIAKDKTPAFSFVDAPEDGLQPFETHVARYAPLLLALKTRARFVFVSGVETKIARAQVAFRRAFEAPPQEITALLLRYFTLEDRIRRKDFAGLLKRDYVERAELANRFTGARYESLFERWRSGGHPGEGTTPLHVEAPEFSTLSAPSLDH